MLQSSLRRKVLLGYALISALALGLSLFTLVELRLLSTRLFTGEQFYQFLNDVLEMRRYEKNFFLYQQQEDMEQLLLYVERARQDLNEAEALVSRPRADLIEARGWLDDYQRLARASLETDPEGAKWNESRLRGLGKALVTTAEELADAERQVVHRALERHRLLLLVAMLVAMGVILLVGAALSRRIVQPLRQIEEAMAGVAEGRFTRIHIPANDQEIVSLTRAFNRVLDELRLRQKHLLRSEKLASLGTLLSGVAHELNNPLSNISTSSQILAEELDSEDADFRRELVEQIDQQTRRARDIVRSLLDLARDRGFQRAEVPLADTIGEAIRFSKGNIPTRIRVLSEIPFETVVMGDRRRLQQAFINLIKNAVDAIPEQGEVRIRLVHPPSETRVDPESWFAACRCRAPWCDVEVVDTGSGIAEADLGRIFDPFFTTKPVGQGSGLGLAVVYEVVEEHAGCIAVESEPGRGSRFVVRLPIKQEDGDG
ncbi:MAG: HAMP domain-containing histidine kinase [Magnetococcales bacterium]|nr:HAMP domain-containing histidine kinase [Magnetococcales bacterium]